MRTIMDLHKFIAKMMCKEQFNNITTIKVCGYKEKLVSPQLLHNENL